MTLDRNLSSHLAAACLALAVLAPVTSAQEAEKTEEKPDLAKRALDVLFESGAEKDADAEKQKNPRAEKTAETTKPAEGDTAKPETTATSEKPEGTGKTPGTPWPNKGADGKPRPKPFVPPGGATGAPGGTPEKSPPHVKPTPSDPGTGGETSVPQQPTPKPAPVPATAKTYKIEPGDTFSSIAIKLYDDEKKWAAIAQANPLVDPTRLKVGQVIRLPDLARAAQEREAALREAAEKVAAAGSDGTAPSGPVTVTVQPGDTLSHIAHRVYGKARHWTVIYEANKDQLKDPGDVKVGQKLKIPPKPAD